MAQQVKLLPYWGKSFILDSWVFCTFCRKLSSMKSSSFHISVNTCLGVYEICHIQCVHNWDDHPSFYFVKPAVKNLYSTNIKLFNDSWKQSVTVALRKGTRLNWNHRLRFCIARKQTSYQCWGLFVAMTQAHSKFDGDLTQSQLNFSTKEFKWKVLNPCCYLQD